MLIMDMPNVPPQVAPVLMQTADVVQKTPSSLDSESLYGAMGVCVVSPTLAKMGIGSNSSLTNGLSLYPQGTALRRIPEASDNTALQMAAQDASVQVLQQPKHGVIVAKDGDFNYVPNQGYVGNDNVVFLVNIDGRIVKTVYYINVVDVELTSRSFDSLYKKYCPGETDWRISSGILDVNSIVSTLTQSWMNIAQSNMTLSIADLSGAAVGQTTGSTITLDTNAAGYNWFIDTTPADNSEFLPTSNPNEWVAKEGSAAYGKMDMLSVLLHEYGHALGIDHSADELKGPGSNNFLATIP